jgi:hypothetical protein
MDRAEKLAELRSLQARIDAIRKELEFAPPGKVIYWAPLGICADDTVVVEADGFGGATTSVVEGNYPVDYLAKFEKFFPRESEALSAAEEIDRDGASPREIPCASA